MNTLINVSTNRLVFMGGVVDHILLRNWSVCVCIVDILLSHPSARHCSQLPCIGALVCLFCHIFIHSLLVSIYSVQQLFSICIPVSMTHSLSVCCLSISPLTVCLWEVHKLALSVQPPTLFPMFTLHDWLPLWQCHGLAYIRATPVGWLAQWR